MDVNAVAYEPETDMKELMDLMERSQKAFAVCGTIFTPLAAQETRTIFAPLAAPEAGTIFAPFAAFLRHSRPQRREPFFRHSQPQKRELETL